MTYDVTMREFRVLWLVWVVILKFPSVYLEYCISLTTILNNKHFVESYWVLKSIDRLGINIPVHVTVLSQTLYTKLKAFDHLQLSLFVHFFDPPSWMHSVNPYALKFAEFIPFVGHNFSCSMILLTDNSL